MLKYLVTVAAVSCCILGCSLSTEKCLQKEGFNNCEDFKEAMKKAVGNDEVYRFHSIAKKCGCGTE
ncbi:MAG: hypothetical protein JXA71_12360 [Chitinispirillaceae bacterium]|nr:hypothetical protein [Chitinispirillaceae bacterium]